MNGALMVRRTEARVVTDLLAGTTPGPACPTCGWPATANPWGGAGRCADTDFHGEPTTFVDESAYEQATQEVSDLAAENTTLKEEAEIGRRRIVTMEQTIENERNMNATLRQEVERLKAERYLPVPCSLCGRLRVLYLPDTNEARCEKCGADNDVLSDPQPSPAALRSHLRDVVVPALEQGHAQLTEAVGRLTYIDARLMQPSMDGRREGEARDMAKEPRGPMHDALTRTSTVLHETQELLKGGA